MAVIGSAGGGVKSVTRFFTQSSASGYSITIPANTVAKMRFIASSSTQVQLSSNGGIALLVANNTQWSQHYELAPGTTITYQGGNGVWKSMEGIYQLY